MKTMVNGFSAALLECSRMGYVEINHNTGKTGESEFILTEKGASRLSSVHLLNWAKAQFRSSSSAY
ncbi:MAG: hypothetical protein IPP40_17945 [bacterium]|nr:hypothetical protein [bacterium]